VSGEWRLRRRNRGHNKGAETRYVTSYSSYAESGNDVCPSVFDEILEELQ
jgi:hypothetical protein